MKFFLHLIILAFIATSSLAQSYTYRPTPWTQPFVQTLFDAPSAQVYIGVTPSTNTAKLNGNNTFTGSNYFPGYGQVIYTTNITISSLAATASVLTNTGDFASMTQLIDIPMPALGSNDLIGWTSLISRPTGNTTAGNVAVFIGNGDSTNCIYYAPGTWLTSTGPTAENMFTLFTQTSNTNQWQARPGGGTFNLTGQNFANTATNGWRFRFGAWTQTSFSGATFMIHIYRMP